MPITLYRPNLSLTSGAGQLIRMQAEGLRAAGEDARVACRRGSLKFRLKTRLRVRRASTRQLQKLAASPHDFLVDHGMELPEADLVFVHNLMTEAVRYLDRPDWTTRAAQEAAFFQALRPHTPIVANSHLVKRALTEHFALPPDRIVVHYPGFDSDRFNMRDRAAAAAKARRALGIGLSDTVIGFDTSGDLEKRGLDIFLAAAERIAAAKPDVRFLVAGARRLPDAAAKHALVTTRRLLYRPKSSRPERWFAALDVFLYPARFEEFGMVVSEAQASGLPVLTSRRVGAAECLPPSYERWLLDAPDPEAFAGKALALLEDEAARAGLTAAGVASVPAFDRAHYVESTVKLIRRCAREAKANGP